MAGLQAEELSNEFLKNFIPETIFLVNGEHALPSPAVQDTIVPESATIAPPVETPSPQSPLKETPKLPELPKASQVPLTYKTIGENKKGVIVLVTIPDAEFMELPQLVFLQKILAAIGFSPADVAYVNNLAEHNTVFEELQQTIKVNYIISFASRVDSKLPHDKFTLYNPVKLGTVPILFSHSLADLEKDQEKKVNLWEALKKMFQK
jgi:hypothetical protein